MTATVTVPDPTLATDVELEEAIAEEAAARESIFLDDGKINPIFLPAIALDQPPIVVGSQAAMLALVVPIGQIVKRTDIDGGAPFMLASADATQLSNWVRITGDYALISDLATRELLIPSITGGDVAGLANGQLYIDEDAPSTGLEIGTTVGTALEGSYAAIINGKQVAIPVITDGNVSGLADGQFYVDEQASVAGVAFGTTAGTVAEGNDTRIAGALPASVAATTYATQTSASAALADPDAQSGKAMALRTFWSALADRDNNPVNVMFLGDSVTEGQGATTHTKRWQSRLASAIRRRFPTQDVPSVAGGNYIPVFYASSTIAASNPWVIAGSPVQASNFGLGSRYIRMTGGTHSATLTVTASRIDLLWAGGSAGSRFQYTVDGGSATVVDTGTGSPLVDGNVTTISLASPATSHTVVVTWNAGGTVNFEGAVVYNSNETKGLRFYDAAHSGFATATFQSGNGAAALAGLVPNVVKPHLIVVNLGLNDQNTAVTPATFQTTLASLVSNLQNYCTGAGLHKPSIVLLANYPANGSYTYPWAQYVAAIQAVATTDPALYFFDLGKRFADQASDASLAMTADTTHPSDKGHTFIADLLGDVLAYSSTPLDYVDKGSFTAQGDLPVATGPGAVSRLALGADTYVLTADSTLTKGVKWAPPGTPGAHGATHAQGAVDDIGYFAAWQDANSIETIARPWCSGTLTVANAFAYFTFFVPTFNKTISALNTLVRTGAGTGTTLARMGLFTVDASNNLALVARTASNTALFTTTGAVASGALDTTGGYPASYALSRGTRYAFGILSIGAATQPTFAAAMLAHALGGALGPAIASNTASTQTDFTTAYTAAQQSFQGSVFYGRMA